MGIINNSSRGSIRILAMKVFGNITTVAVDSAVNLHLQGYLHNHSHLMGIEENNRINPTILMLVSIKIKMLL